MGAAGCDLDHDVPWPHGPTCACNLGPLCRRHHRIKQLGWLKNRNDDGSVRWTSPTGRTWLSPGQHDVPRATRPVPPVTPNGAYAGLDPLTEEAERLTADPSDPWLDGAFGEGVTPADTEPVKDESLLRTVDDLWSLLHDPTSWHDVPPPAEGCCD